jgi:hypothetical protein
VLETAFSFELLLQRVELDLREPAGLCGRDGWNGEENNKRDNSASHNASFSVWRRQRTLPAFVTCC